MFPPKSATGSKTKRWKPSSIEAQESILNIVPVRIYYRDFTYKYKYMIGRWFVFKCDYSVLTKFCKF